MTIPNHHLCPECGKPIPAESQHRLCPSCLIAQALASHTLAPETERTAPQQPPPAPEEIAGKFPQFEITDCLGRGGMGVVYKARQKSLDRWVAIKILAPERVGEEKFAARFAREAATLAKLSHPNIVTIHDFGQTDHLFYLVMEFVDGVNLRDLLRDGKLEPQQALAIVPPICDALQYAHDKGIVHRDIKPENLLLDREGRVKIADFGIAALIGAEGERAGTPPYMAPEQAQAEREVDNRADIYALGVVLYEMLTGERPDKELVAPSKKVQIDVRLDEIVLRALEKKPELRFQQATAFKTRLETISQQHQSQEQEPPAMESQESSPEGEQQLRELRAKIVSGTGFCFPASMGVASHLPASDPRVLIGVWGVLLLGATLAAVFAARKDAKKLQIAGKLVDLNAVGTLPVLMACVAQIPWLQRPWIVLIELVLAAGFLFSLAQLFRGGLFPFSLRGQIWTHMSAGEKREMMLRNFLFTTWNLATWFVPIFMFFKVRHLGWVYAGGVLAIGLSVYPLWFKILREGEAATAWARQRGITPEQLKQDSIVRTAPWWVRVLFGTSQAAILAVIYFYLAPGFGWSGLAAWLRLGAAIIASFGLTILYQLLLQLFSKEKPISTSSGAPAESAASAKGDKGEKGGSNPSQAGVGPLSRPERKPTRWLLVAVIVAVVVFLIANAIIGLVRSSQSERQRASSSEVSQAIVSALAAENIGYDQLEVEVSGTGITAKLIRPKKLQEVMGKTISTPLRGELNATKTAEGWQVVGTEDLRKIFITHKGQSTLSGRGANGADSEVQVSGTSNASKSRSATALRKELRAKSTQELIQAALAQPLDQDAGEELQLRQLTQAEAKQIVDGLFQWLERDYPNGLTEPTGWQIELVNQLFRQGLIPEARWICFLKALNGNLRCQPIRLREGEPQFTLQCQAGYPFGISVFGPEAWVMMNEIVEVNVDGKALPFSADSFGDSPSLVATVRPSTLAQGKHKLKLTVRSALVTSKDFKPTRVNAPSSEWPPAKATWTRSTEVDLLVEPAKARS